ncbi:MAG TPA: MarR family winged helix-turn-helix transcriptional regulator [Rhizomicrobium sp.]|jgi:DNA-binding MarR family transcriptional regulator|nr:MarR family winged helix-turn-helix transcriptional regulator [Rhizomicrobium sp.]
MTRNQDLADCQNCLCLASRSAARAITSVYDQEMRPYGIRGTQFTLLTTLMLMGERPIGELAEFLSMDRTTLTRNIALLEAKGWTRSRTSEADARSHVVSVTGAGEKMVRKALPAWRAAQAKVANIIGPAGVAAMRRLTQAEIS